MYQASISCPSSVPFLLSRGVEPDIRGAVETNCNWLIKLMGKRGQTYDEPPTKPSTIYLCKHMGIKPSIEALNKATDPYELMTHDMFTEEILKQIPLDSKMLARMNRVSDSFLEFLAINHPNFVPLVLDKVEDLKGDVIIRHCPQWLDLLLSKEVDTGSFLQYACSCSLDVVERLVEKGFEPKKRHLKVAVLFSKVQIVKFLVDLGVEIDSEILNLSCILPTELVVYLLANTDALPTTLQGEGFTVESVMLLKSVGATIPDKFLKQCPIALSRYTN